jgi:hypothetical protein
MAWCHWQSWCKYCCNWNWMCYFTIYCNMPPHCTRVKLTNPEALRLTEAMTKYYTLIETCSQCIRTLLNKSQLYKEEVKKWQRHSEFYWPSWGDKAARERFFSAVDKACKTESRAPERCVLNSLLWCPSQYVSSQVAISSFLCVQLRFRLLLTRIL